MLVNNQVKWQDFGLAYFFWVTLAALALALGRLDPLDVAWRPVTVSQGVVTVRPDVELEPADLINRADKALYQAKDAGRNAIKVA